MDRKFSTAGREIGYAMCVIRDNLFKMNARWCYRQFDYKLKVLLQLPVVLREKSTFLIYLTSKERSNSDYYTHGQIKQFTPKERM